MKKFLSVFVISAMFVACNNSAEDKSTIDTTSDSVTVDTMGTSPMPMDTSRMRSNADSAIRK